MALSDQDKQEIRKIVQEEMKPYLDQLEPYLKGAAGLGILWKVLVAIGGLVVIWVQIKQGLWTH